VFGPLLAVNHSVPSPCRLRSKTARASCGPERIRRRIVWAFGRPAENSRDSARPSRRRRRNTQIAQTHSCHDCHLFPFTLLWC